MSIALKLSHKNSLKVWSEGKEGIKNDSWVSSLRYRVFDVPHVV